MYIVEGVISSSAVRIPREREGARSSSSSSRMLDDRIREPRLSAASPRSILESLQSAGRAQIDREPQAITMATPAPATASAASAAPALVPETEYDVGLNRDGEKVKDPSYYRLLGVLAAASDAELKKAYRKQSLRWHPGSLLSSLFPQL